MTNSFVDNLRHRLVKILRSEPALEIAFQGLGDLGRAKFSRARLLRKMAEDNGANLELATEAALGLELVHLATLVHDDVIDDADLRRDSKNLRSLRGDRCAILFGDYLFAKAIQQVQNTQSPDLSSAFISRIVETCKGESIQDLSLTWEDSSPCEDLLTEAARGKTGALFAFCCEAPLWTINHSNSIIEKARECGFLCGLAFQLADDILDIAGSTDDLGKPAGNDLLKNTMTLPLFFLMEAQGKDWKQLRNAYEKDTTRLKEDFFNSSAYPKLMERIDLTHTKLFDLGMELEKEGVVIRPTLDIFWTRYVEKRIDQLKDRPD